MGIRGSSAERRRDGRSARGTGPERRGTAQPAAAIRVLVVDDDSVDRMAVRRALLASGSVLEIAEADGVLAAIELLTTQPVDCVFLDYNLPDGDGLTFLRGLRAAGLDTPVVMLTGQEDQAVAAELVRSGAADYIPKALLDPGRLIRSLERALARP